MTDHSSVKEVRQGNLEFAVPTYNQTRPVEYHEIASHLGVAPGALVYAFPTTYFDLKGLEVQLSFQATVANLVVGAANLVVTFFECKPIAGVDTYFLLETMAAVNSPAVVAGSVGKVVISPTVKGATHFRVTGNVTVADTSRVYFGYDLYEENDVELSASDIEIGAVELKDGSTDTRAVVNRADTARTVATPVVVTQMVDALGNVVGASAGMPFNPTHHSPFDFTATRTNDTTVAITVGPVVMSTTNTLVAYITKRSAANVITTYINGSNGVSLYISANDTLTLIGGTVGATDVIQSVGVRIFDKENVILTNSKRTGEIAPVDTRMVPFTYSPYAVGKTILAVGTYTYPGATGHIVASANAGGGHAKLVTFNGVAQTADTDAGDIITITLEGTNELAGTDATFVACAFYDNTSGIKTAVDSIVVPRNTTRRFILDFSECGYYRIRMKVVVAHANSIDTWIYACVSY